MSEPSEELNIALPSIDVGLYLNPPQLATRETVALGRALLSLLPEDLLGILTSSAAILESRVIETEVAIDMIHRLSGKNIRADEQVVDLTVDGAWLVIRDRIVALRHYSRPGFERFAADPDAKVDYGALVDLAKRADRLSKRIFGTGGLGFIRLRYADQAVVMASILRIIKDDELAAEVDAICGFEVTAILRDCQRRYQDMVNRRAARARLEGNVPNLGVLRGRLRRAIRNYCAVYVGCLDEDDPETLALLTRCLQPMISFRKPGRSSGTSEEDDVELDEQDELMQLAEELAQAEQGEQAEVDEPSVG